MPLCSGGAPRGMAAVPGSVGDHDHNGNRDGGGSKPTDPSDVAGNGNLGPDPAVDVINLDDAPLSMRGSAPAVGGQAAGACLRAGPPGRLAGNGAALHLARRTATRHEITMHTELAT